MALSTWYVIKHLRERHVVFIAIVNSFVHVFMYTYYMLAAMGPNYRKYLWWKPYVTKLQIGQFIIIIGYQLSLVLYGCDINSSSMIFFILNTISFLLLFANFYKKAYITKREQYKQQQLKSK
ncbi:hypothetical protein AAG570_005089 [Ranatra chinensis]|uniref:Elongation of very long chain fatty acids protein n=1 Tax=Ranatra chinensis TaxID=642074 RepID=A0ABD0XZF9_9HEMI